MKTMRKEDMDKAAWSWAENTDLKSISQEHIELAYRLKLNVCKPNSCRRNCRGNPKCLSGLGESKWLGPKAVAAAKEIWGTDLEDPNEERRKEGQFVGLRNLGATCYVNSLLQLWFHNIEFRKAIYSWCPEEDPQEVCNATLNGIDGMEYVPETSIGHLQLLFALLEFGNRRTIDPTAFICSLGLNTALQQDAQEFSKLFISMLEERLSHQSSPIVKNIINNQFCGTYFYVTKCQTCGTESSHPSLFYELELNVAGHSTLSGCLEEFLKEEKLEGDDKYHCGVCMSKQNASRSTKLDRLPPVLNLQLLRFVWQNGCKKKINSFIQFPENLDMSSYVGQPAGSLLYMLTAVLIHRGHSAHSGHYIAHIYDNATSTWYKFNDDNVDKMEGKKLKLLAEDVEEGIKKSKPQRVPKGFLSSNSAYMLVYKLQNENMKSENEKSNIVEEKVEAKTALPERLYKLVQRENENFDSWVQDMLDSRVEAVESSKARQEEMQNLYNMLHIVEEAPFEFVLTDWLVKWLSNDKVSPVDNSKVLCHHKRLDPNMVPLTKCISVAAAEVLYAKYGGGPRLRSESCMCWPCVRNACKIMQLKTKLAEDSKKLTNLLKYKLGVSEPAFWVGKNSLKCWRKLVLVEHCKTKEKRDEDNGACDESRVQSESKSAQSATEMDFQESKVETSTEDSAKIDSVEEELVGTTKVVNEAAEMSSLEPSVISCDTSENNDIGDCVEHHSGVVDRSVNKSVMEAEISSTVGNGAAEMKASESGVESSGEENSAVGKCIASLETKSSDETPCPNRTSQFSHANGSKDVLSALNEVHSSEICEEELNKRTDVLQVTSSSDISQHNGSIVDPPHAKPTTTTKENDEEDEEEEEEEEEGFNEDILCVHGDLCWEENNRRLVSLEAWNILASYFPGTKGFPQDTNPCKRCQVLVTEGKATLNQYRQSAALQKERLSDLYFSKNRRSLFTSATAQRPNSYPQELLHLVSKVFVDSWKRFVKSPTRRTPESCIDNANLLCPHGGLLYDPLSPEESGPSGKFVVVTDAEWAILTEFYSADHDITGRRDEHDEEWVLQPAVCQDCVLARLRLEEMELLQYEKAKIFVRKVAASSDNALGDGVNSAAGGDAQSSECKDDPEYQGTEAKRPRLSPVELNQTLLTPGGASSESRVRKSTRHRRVRGEKELVISSKLTLLEFKVLIMKLFHVAPYDQHLSVDGRDLLDNNATLGALRVYPESVVILKADEPCDANLIDDYMKNATPEEGFKGTELLK